MSLEVYDSFTHRGTIPADRDSTLNPTEIINNLSVLAPEVPVEIEKEDDDPEVPIEDNRDFMGLYARNVDPELIRDLMNRPQVRQLSPEEAEDVLRKDTIKRMTHLEKDVEGKFGML